MRENAGAAAKSEQLKVSKKIMVLDHKTNFGQTISLNVKCGGRLDI